MVQQSRLNAYISETNILSFIKHSWSNGRIIAFQAIGPGSTPGGCKTSFSRLRDFFFALLHVHLYQLKMQRFQMLLVMIATFLPLLCGFSNPVLVKTILLADCLVALKYINVSLILFPRNQAVTRKGNLIVVFL